MLALLSEEMVLFRQEDGNLHNKLFNNSCNQIISIIKSNQDYNINRIK